MKAFKGFRIRDAWAIEGFMRQGDRTTRWFISTPDGYLHADLVIRPSTRSEAGYTGWFANRRLARKALRDYKLGLQA